jgi:peroxiredoxin
MRWGVDANEDGQIERWVQISAEEVSQEILRAVVTRNITRLQALLPSEQELKALELSAQETNRIRESITKITPKFQETVSKLGALGENTHWLHLETAAPQCLSAEATGGKYDLIGYRSGTIVYEANGKADFVQTGEMIQVRGAWRLIGGPAPGHDMESLGQRTPGQISINDVMKPLIDELGELDKNAPKDGDQVAIVRYNLARAAILERIAATYPKLDDAEQWLRQVADCLSAAAQGNGANIAAYKQLVALRDRVVKAQPGSPLAGYITYREMQVDYANQLRTPPTGEGGLAKIQETCRERLKKFVQDYPNAEDTPDALLTLAMISEFVNKETEAKNYYNFMVTNHGQHPLAAKAAGALRRLNSDGQMFELTGPALGTGQQVNIAQMRGKVVVVYYWASWNQQCAADFFKLKTLLNLYGNKGLELVSVSVDNSADEAQKFITNAQAPGTHLYQPGGLEGPLAVQYGVMVLPDLFLVGRDGKVVSHAVQMSGLEDEIKKLMEK